MKKHHAMILILLLIILVIFFILTFIPTTADVTGRFVKDLVSPAYSVLLSESI